MPFPPQDPRSFTRQGIEWLAPNQKGCYGLIQQKAAGPAWVYVGKADDVRARLLQHLNGDNPCINNYPPTHFLTEITQANDAREKMLIVEYDPHCNKKVG